MIQVCLYCGFYPALPQLGPGPWVPDTSSPGSTDWVGLGAGSLAQSGWRSAREPDTTEGHSQGTDNMLLILCVLVTCCVFMWLHIFDPHYLWFCSSEATVWNWHVLNTVLTLHDIFYSWSNMLYLIHNPMCVTKLTVFWWVSKRKGILCIFGNTTERQWQSIY